MFGIEIGTKEIKIAEVKKIGNKFYLEKFEVLDESSAIKNGFKTKIKNAVITIPDDNIKFFIHHFENSQKYFLEDIKKIIIDKTKNSLKIPVKNINVAFQILRQYFKNGIYHYDIFAEIIDIDVLNNFKNLLKELKIKPIAIDSSTCRLVNLCKGENFILINITEKEVILFCFFGGIPAYIRRITKEELKLSDNTTDLESMKYFFRFIEDTVNYYSKKNNSLIEKIFIAGTTMDLIGVLNRFLNIPVEFIYKAKLIDLKCNIDDESLSNIASCIGAVVGEYE